MTSEVRMSREDYECLVAYNQGLKDDKKRLEEFLDKAMAEDPKEPGIVEAGPEGMLYRVTTGNSSKFVLLNPSLGDVKPKIGDHVICTKNVLVDLVPDSLQVKKELPQFDLIEWADVGGLRSQKEEIRDAVELPLKHPELYAEFGAEPLKGICLYGMPGCGKTLIAKAIASEVLRELKELLEDSFVYIKGAELLSMWVGNTENAIRNLFARAREHYRKTGVRAVIFMDEAEALLNERGSRRSSDVDTTIVPTFLAEMDGFEGGNPLIIISTNRLDLIDKAILRDGRIDLKVEIKPPRESDIEEIFAIHLGKTKLMGDIAELANFGTVVVRESSLIGTISGATIQNIVKKATQRAIKRKVSDKSSETGVTKEDLEYALMKHVGKAVVSFV